MFEQLYKKEDNEYIKIFPFNYIQNLIDSESGNTLASILTMFNNIALPYQNNAKDTRDLIPVLLRRKGLWITYNNGEEFITEYFCGTAEEVTSDWTNDDNWERVPNLKYVQENANKIPDGIITPDKLSPALQELIKQNNTIINLADDEDLEEVNSAIKFKNKEYNINNASGLGRKILRKNWKKIGNKLVNVLTQEMINTANTIYIIQYNFDLNEQEITIPKRCILYFEGGSFSNGTLYLGSSIIKSSLSKIFDNVLIYDSKKNESPVKTNHPLYVEWFGAVGDGETDDTQAINNCANSAGKSIEFQTKTYYITDTITIGCREVITNNATINSKIKRKFALVTNNPSSNTNGFLHILGGLTLCNLDTDFIEIESSAIFNSVTVPVSTIEDINTSSVVYQDFTVIGAEIGDMVFVEHDEIKIGFIELSGEVISKNTVRIYANSKYFSSTTIDDLNIKIKVLSGVSHGFNVGGSVHAFNMIRLIKYTGVSCGIGSGVDISCGIRYPGNGKVYYSHLEVNTYSAGGIAFSCSSRNNCNSFKIISFSAPYSTTSGWPKTYPYHACIINGINNYYELLSIEGIYHKESIVIKGIGNYCNNVYTEFPYNEEYSSIRVAISSKIYSNANNFRVTYGSYTYKSFLKGNNNIYRDYINSFNGGKTSEVKTSCNLLSNFSFRYNNYSWNNYTTGSNKSITFVEGPLPNTKACRIYTENGRITLAQSIALNDLTIKNVPISISCWVRGNIKASLYIIDSPANITSSDDEQSEEWHFLQTTMIPNSILSTELSVQFRGEENSTGYLEFFNPCVSYGAVTESLSLIDNTVYEVNKSGILFNSGSAIAAGETYSEDIELDWIKQESMIKLTWKVSDKETFLQNFKLEYIIFDGFIRLYLTNITESNQYSGRVYPYIQIL